MRITPKKFWCEHCHAEIPFRRPTTEIVQAQAFHLFAEHGIDIYEDEDGPEPEWLLAELATKHLPHNERFVVTSLTGYLITPDMHSPDTSGHQGTEWYVVDTVYNCEVVATFQNVKGTSGEIAAHKKAWLLNLAEHRWMEKASQ